MKDFNFAGLECNLINEYGEMDLNPATFLALPVPLICGLAAASYEFPEQKQAIIDALTPFQIVSKIWSCQCVNNLMNLETDYDQQQIVFVGSWFGQQSAMLARYAGRYSEFSPILVDKDPVACRVAASLLRSDQYHNRTQPVVIPQDIFEQAFDPGTLFVWNGLEHFDSTRVEDFVSKHSECAFVFQSTSMPADDHIYLASDVEDLMGAVPPDWEDGVLYKGEIATNLGSRYMMAVCGPEFEIVPE